MNHTEAGINKGVSESVYPKDILSDSKLRMCSLKTRGAWYECLLNMWHDKTCEIVSTYPGLARLWGCELNETKEIIDELTLQQPCDVTVNNTKITLVSRRLKRRIEYRKSVTERQKKHRNKENDRTGHGDVTLTKGLPSLTSSSSPSISSSKKNIYTADFLEFWKEYPRKKSKSAAFKAWQKAVRVVSHETIMLGVTQLNMAIESKSQDIDFLKHPPTWLNQGCWDDEYKGQQEPVKAETDPAILDYAKQLKAFRRCVIFKDYDMPAFYQKIRDNCGPGGVERVKAAVKGV